MLHTYRGEDQKWKCEAVGANSKEGEIHTRRQVNKKEPYTGMWHSTFITSWLKRLMYSRSLEYEKML